MKWQKFNLPKESISDINRQTEIVSATSHKKQSVIKELRSADQ